MVISNTIKKRSLVVELSALNQTYLEGKGEVRKSKLVWKCKFKPTPMSQYYTVELHYSLESLPVVYIPRCELKYLDEPDFPHHYDLDADGKVKLCLYKYADFKAARCLTLAKTVIPWAIEWLFYYEIWCLTGEWQGGGVHTCTHCHLNPLTANSEIY